MSDLRASGIVKRFAVADGSLEVLSGVDVHIQRGESIGMKRRFFHPCNFADPRAALLQRDGENARTGVRPENVLNRFLIDKLEAADAQRFFIAGKHEMPGRLKIGC